MKMIAPKRHHFTPRAQAVWDQIPQEAQARILNAVWCGHCRDSSSIVDYTGTWEKPGDIRLQGFCAHCGHVVIHILEESELKVQLPKRRK